MVQGCVHFSSMLGFIYKMRKNYLKIFGSGTPPFFLVCSLHLFGDDLYGFFSLPVVLFLLMPMTLLLLIVQRGSCINSF